MEEVTKQVLVLNHWYLIGSVLLQVPEQVSENPPIDFG